MVHFGLTVLNFALILLNFSCSPTSFTSYLHNLSFMHNQIKVIGNGTSIAVCEWLPEIIKTSCFYFFLKKSPLPSYFHFTFFIPFLLNPLEQSFQLSTQFGTRGSHTKIKVIGNGTTIAVCEWLPEIIKIWPIYLTKI
jgi:hypothetical protein